MYRTTDPRFRRRLNEIGQTLESANETAQSGLYIFGQNYVRPCVSSIGQCLEGCVGASCPGFSHGRGGRRQRGRTTLGGRERAELSFDFYDDWDEEDGLLGWGDDGGYGTVAAQTVTASQPSRPPAGGMSYSKGRRRSADAGGGGAEPVIISGSGNHGFWGRLFGGKPLRYHPSAADLQDHPGARGRYVRDVTEGEALLEDSTADLGHGRKRSGTQASHETGSSYSSRGDLFPSDNEDDAVPLDDEFAMVLERRTTQSGMDTENSSDKTHRKREKRPSAGSRTSTRRTFSSRSSKSGRRERSGTSSSAAPPAVIDESSAAAMSEAVALKDESFTREALQGCLIEERPPSLSELEEQERELERAEEEAIERKRQEAFRAAAERGLTIPASPMVCSKETAVPTDELGDDTRRGSEGSEALPIEKGSTGSD